MTTLDSLDWETARRGRSAVVFGVGREIGLGAAIANRFARERLHVFVCGRTAARLQRVAHGIEATGGGSTPIVADVSDEVSVTQAIAAATADATLDAVVFNAGGNRWCDIEAMEASFFERVWRDNCFGAFVVGREAARVMTKQGSGSILYTSASAAWRGQPSYAAFAAAKGGARLLAQSMAKELGPKGVHVATIVVDGVVDGDRVRALAPHLLEDRPQDGAVSPEAVAEAFWQVHRQSPTAWTHELDLRPYCEQF